MVQLNKEGQKLSKTGVSSNFIRTIIEQDIKSDKHNGRVLTRFPPEPNGYLHIGHAKSICLNFTVAAENGGLCNLRFDDTNPEKESQEFVDSIKQNIKWLGFQWNGEVRYSSNYFGHLYELALQLIKNNKAFVCSLSAEQSRDYRGTLTEPGQNSPDRGRSLEENHALFTRMRNGEFADGEYTLRAKIDMNSPNINMRDPILYRIRHVSHHQTGNEWCIYPTYDYTHCISDAIENVTHSLCTLEFEDHRPLYEWILGSLELVSLQAISDLGESELTRSLPKQTEFSKLKLNYTMMGKRNLKVMVEDGVVAGWDDPRMPTLSGMRRRGYTAASIRNFCESVGVSRSESVVDVSMLEHAVREDLDRNSPRVMCVLNPIKVTIKNIEQGEVEELSLLNHPKDESMGRRNVPFTRELYIDRSDFEETPPEGFKRLALGKEVRLRGAYVVKCEEIIKGNEGEIQELICVADKDTLGKRPEGRKVKGVIHWVSLVYGQPITVRLYDRLFTVENPESKDIEDYKHVLNLESLEVIENCIIEPSALNDSESCRFQFEREGYFILDEIDSSDGGVVYNRTITLRDSRA
ncbi:MAG: glutamine--tRNA ligase/YqeY domain fusion protein [Gammaproteobacteria bacterium]|nr:glutamine--tRNA ligase/YqeY domain fusion protein [Gammaproteobacteria bacterium]